MHMAEVTNILRLEVAIMPRAVKPPSVLPGLLACLVTCLFMGACSKPALPTAMTLRKTFRTQLKDPPARRMLPLVPPANLFELVRYPAPLGSNAAYVTPVREGNKRPAMVWLHGGFNWGVSALAWQAAYRENDQSARAFREAGMVMMYPSLRGADDSPGEHEYFLGEADDVVAAIDFLAGRPDVDPERIYLGGHSTGGTLALIAAAHAPRLKGAYVFGPTHDVSEYGRTGTALDRATGPELWMRNPVSFVEYLRVPTQVIEGSDEGNTDAFEPLRKAAKSAPLSFLLVPGATHFTVLAPVTELLARKLVDAKADAPTVTLTDAEDTRRERHEGKTR